MIPGVDRDSQAWWDALARHELVHQRCDTCGRWRWPPRAMCGECGSFEWSWQPVCGRGGHYFFRSPATSFEIAAWAASSAAFGDAACRVTEFITVVAGDHTMVISGRFGIGTATST